MRRLPKISNAAFWDVKIDKTSTTEFETYSSYIIQKVFDFGTLDDIIQITTYYGIERIKNEIITTNLKKRTIALCCVLFNLRTPDPI